MSANFSLLWPMLDDDITVCRIQYHSNAWRKISLKGNALFFSSPSRVKNFLLSHERFFTCCIQYLNWMPAVHGCYSSAFCPISLMDSTEFLFINSWNIYITFPEKYIFVVTSKPIKSFVQIFKADQWTKTWKNNYVIFLYPMSLTS